MIQNPQLKWFIAILVVALPTAGAQAVIIDTVLVGNTGNTDDTHGAGYGAVGYAYSIGMYEVTNAQYAEFLNNVAATDTYGLYDELMGLSAHGGITRSGSSGAYTYSTIAGRGDMPVNFVNLWDAARFANWLHNGQPTGAQGPGTTEDGAYTNIGNQYTFARQGGALFFIPTEDEWYKAAYHKNDGDTGNYFDYATGSNIAPTAESPPGGSNSANYDEVVDAPTNVGAYGSSESPYGTFDQSGNVMEWTETASGSNRILRDGDFAHDITWLSADAPPKAGSPGSLYGSNLGFRVASSEVIPEPGSLAMLTGLAVMGLFWWRRRTA